MDYCFEASSSSFEEICQGFKTILPFLKISLKRDNICSAIDLRGF
jgi:hypothetical protein